MTKNIGSKTKEKLDDLLEDLEMCASSKFIKTLEKARKSKITYTLEEIKKRHGLT